MANRLNGSIYICDSANQFLSPKVDGKNNLCGGKDLKIKSIALDYSAVPARFSLVTGDSTGTPVVVLTASNPEIIFTDGVWFSDLMVQTITNGTGFIHLG